MPQMPCSKYLVMLYMFEVIVEEGSFKKDAVLCKFDLSDVSFKRYLGCLREYFLYVHPTWRIAYRRSKLAYVLFRGM
jgi:hypothetical protein